MTLSHNYQINYEVSFGKVTLGKVCHELECKERERKREIERRRNGKKIV